MAKGITQKCRLLLEGREVPFVAATLVCNIGEPMTAVIELVPLQFRSLFRIPTTSVTLISIVHSKAKLPGV